MLGDNLLFGQTVNNIDKKGRIFLPAGSGREKGEKVYVLYDSDINEYKVVPASVIEDEYKKLEGMIDASCNMEMLVECKSLLTKFASSILKECVVDSQGRILLPEIFDENEKVTIIGAGNHFILRQEQSQVSEKKR